MDVDLARMYFSATAAFVPFALHRKSLSNTTAIALQVLIGGADLAALNKGYLTGRTQKWKVDESAIFHLVTTVFILYAPRLKPNTRARMLELLTFGEALHTLSRSRTCTPAPEAPMTQPHNDNAHKIQLAGQLLVVDPARVSKDTLIKRYLWHIEDHLRRKEPRSEYDKAYCLLAGITKNRQESFDYYFRTAGIFTTDRGLFNQFCPIGSYDESSMAISGDYHTSSFDGARNLYDRYRSLKKGCNNLAVIDELDLNYVWLSGLTPDQSPPMPYYD